MFVLAGAQARLAAAVLVLVAGAPGCTGKPPQRDDAEQQVAQGKPPPGEPAESPSPAEDASRTAGKKHPMVGQQEKQALPDSLDKRVAAVVAAPVAADVLLSYAYVARAKSPSGNFRYELHEDGRIFSVEHSGAGRDWQVPFDEPLPDEPERVVDAKKIAEVRRVLEEHGFFAHPGYEARVGTKGGAYTIVRARKNGELHTVVFENVKSPLLDFLYDLAY